MGDLKEPPSKRRQSSASSQTQPNVCICMCNTHTHTKARDTDQHHTRQSHRLPSLQCQWHTLELCGKRR